MYKPFIFLKVIITTILLFAGPLSAKRIGSSQIATERGFHRNYKYHVSLCNRDNLKDCVKAKKKFHHRNKVRENHEGKSYHKVSKGLAWSNDPDIFPEVSISPSSINDR